MTTPDGQSLMRVMTVNRAQGKTTKAVEWVAAGQALPYTPGWSRILIEPHEPAAKHARRMAVEAGLLMRKHAEVVILPLSRVQTMGSVPWDVEFGFDNLDMMLPRVPGRVTFATMTGLAVF